MGELPQNFDRLKASAQEPQVETTAPTNEAQVFADLNEDNKGFFAKLSEGSKQLAGWAYEKIKNTPVVGKLVGKAQIAFHEHWMNKHEEKANGLKGRIEETNAKIAEMENSHAEISGALEELRAQNVPNMKSVEEKLRSIENNKKKLEGTRDGFQGKLEARNEKMKMRTEKRDAVVDEFISKATEKLDLVEKKFEELKDSKNQVELKASIAEVRYRKQIEGLDKQQDAKTKIENALKKLGMTDSEIQKDPSLISLNTSITEGKKAIESSRAEMIKEREGIDKQGRKVEPKVRSFKNKIAEFQRMKEKRPSAVGVEEAQTAYEDEPEPVIESKVEAGTEEFSVKTFIEEFNKFLVEKFGNNKEPEMIDVNKFTEITKGIKELAPDANIQFDEFRNIIPSYLKSIGVDSKRVKVLLGDFYQEKIFKPKTN